MATTPVMVKKAFDTQDELKRHREHCAPAARPLVSLDRAKGQQIRIHRDSDFALYTISELLHETTDAVVRIGLTEDHGKVLELAAAQEPEGSSAGMGQALRIADAMAGSGDGQIILLSDGVGVGVPVVRMIASKYSTVAPLAGVGVLVTTTGVTQWAGSGVAVPNRIASAVTCRA